MSEVEADRAGLVPRTVGPAEHAARRAAARGEARTRAYPLPLYAEDPTGDAVVLAATRALLTATTREQVVTVLHTAVNDLGAGVLPARLAEVQQDALAVDVSLGVGEPRVPVVDPVSVAGMRLTHHLLALVQDASAAAARCDAAARQEQRVTVDVLTGVASRAQVGPRLAAARIGDVVCMIDLDGFKQLNDRHGHAAGDLALRAFGELLRRTQRRGDLCARQGGDEFVVVLEAVTADVARRRMQQVVRTWAGTGDHGTGACVGIAAVTTTGGTDALLAADKALYVAKRQGRNRVEVAPHRGLPHA